MRGPTNMFIPRLESDFRSWVVDQIRRNSGFAQTIETTTKAGVPDIYMVLRGDVCWVELKVGTSSQPLIRKEQRVWGMKHHASGGRSIFLYCCKSDQTLNVYANPIKEVEVRGKYLWVIDKPSYVVPSNTQGMLQILQNILNF